MSVTYDILAVTINHLTGEHGTVTDDGMGEMYGTKALQEFLHHDEIKISDNGETVIIPFHSVHYVSVEKTNVTEEVTDDTCVADCDIMTDPTLTVPDTAIEVDAGAEFDPLLGVTALDSYNHRITPTVEIKASHLQNEDSIDISDENDDPLTVLG